MLFLTNTYVVLHKILWFVDALLATTSVGCGEVFANRKMIGNGSSINRNIVTRAGVDMACFRRRRDRTSYTTGDNNALCTICHKEFNNLSA